MLGLKLAAITGAVCLALGFTAGLKWEQADRYKDATNMIVAIQEQATKSIGILNGRWEGEAARVQIQVEDWNIQNTVDQDSIQRLLNGQSLIRNRFDDLSNTIITTDLGTCQLSDGAIRLLRQASASANRAVELPEDRAEATPE